MCQFKSAIITKSGDVLHSHFTDSHEDLIRLFKLNDTSDVRGEPRFARVEFKPDSKIDLGDASKYTLLIDEARTPEWFDDAMKISVENKLRLIVEGMIITGNVDMLVGGKYILAKGAHVSCIKNCLIEVMLGSSNVGEMLESSKVGEMWESSKVGVMWGSSKVGEMWESSNVGVNESKNKLHTS